MPLSHPIFREISRLVEERGLRAYVIGGYVRDWYLHRPSTDIDVVVAAGDAAGGDAADGADAGGAGVSRTGNLNLAISLELAQNI
jgi:tRNA nucleotidyltransferase/poly(A) polymerase